MGKKKNYRKRKKNKTTTMYLSRPSIVADQMYVKMKYTELITMISTGGNIEKYNFRANSIFDPNETGTGNQPLGRDQWAAFFNRYQVMGSSISAEFSPRETADGSGTVFGIVPVDFTTSITGISQAIEQPYSKHYSCPAKPQSAKTLKSYMSTKKLKGISGDVTLDDRLAAQNGTNPLEQWYWQLFVISSDSLNSAIVDVVVSLTFNVRLFDRKELARS